ncbi:VWA domain-containing protein [Arthrobacter sp. FW306-05-C]|uniref:VWA domain-containing protein n=1 Tax=Arthrobacter sp. FW306-05-C TaxID=2879620 RepID=UPI001F3E390C|nr:VWA domain-containing protein [Arthrobacter sp. FW306-05-C]UKA68853.1 VWA domain-containing protein [Arthrobacter sp. FW306-05-C]
MFWWLMPVAAAAAGVAAAVAWRSKRRGNVRRRPVAHADRLTALPEYQAALRRYRRWLALAATALALLLVSTAVAAARPVSVDTVRPEQHNRDIMLCLDASGSMSSADAAVVEVFAKLAREFDGERIGLTIFDSSAIQVFPLTDDYAYAQEQLQGAKDAFDGKPGSSGFLDGTWSGRGSSLIGDGLASCLNSFPGAGKPQEASGGGTSSQRSRSVVLATDNLLSGKPIMALGQAAALAKDRSVRVYALNPADLDYGPGPDQPGAQLRAAAESTGGAYYALDRPDAVAGIVTGIEQTETSAIHGAPRAVFADVPGLPLVAALLSALALCVVLWRLQGIRLRSKAWLRRGAIVLLLLAAALRPHLPGGTVQAASADLNVFFVVDTTTSMVAEDYDNGKPRLEGVRKDIMAIAEQLPGARFSVITFDTTAHVRMPLSTDTLALQTITDVLEPQVTAYAKGSSITAARQVLSERLAAARDSHPGRPRLVYYLGDGEQTSGREPGPMKVDGGLVAGGAVLGYGTSAGGWMKENTGLADDGGTDGGGEAGTRSGGYVQDTRPGSNGDALSMIDEGRLQAIAGQLGVPYAHRLAGAPVADMMQQAHPGRAERADGQGQLAAGTELYWILAAGAFLLALPEAVALARQLRGLPRAGLKEEKR